MHNKESKFVKYELETIYIGEYIDLKKVQEGVKHYTFLNRDHPLVIHLLEDQYAALTKFGSVTFWNVPHRLRAQFLSEIKPYAKAKKEAYPYDEDTEVVVSGETDQVTFERVSLSHIDINHIKIISYVLSQSVALERYENEIETSLSEIGVIVENLKTSGKAMLREKEVLKQIGKVLSVKQTVVAHLSLFDKPEEVWNSPDLENLYNKLNSEYDLRVRFDVLDEKTKYLSDISQMLMNFLAEKRNAFLEMVIIVLIVIEIGLLFIPPLPDLVSFIRGSF